VNYRKNNNCVHRVLVTDLDGIIKGELSKQISGLAKLKLLMEKEREQHNERIRGAKQRLAMQKIQTGDWNWSFGQHTNPMQRVLQTGKHILCRSSPMKP